MHCWFQMKILWKLRIFGAECKQDFSIEDIFAYYIIILKINLSHSENNRCKCFHGVYISQLLMIASTDLPPIHGSTYDLAAPQISATNTLGSLKAQKTISIRPSSHRGCREKPMIVSRGGESQLSNKASSICIHRHGYCLQWASPCWQGERWREGEMTTREQSHNEK